jgi:TRAP-type C4-dicarboxylate transport system permease large subunit
VIIPPAAMNVFIVRNITKVPIGIIYSDVYPFLISMVLLIILFFVSPHIVLFLPQTLMKSRKASDGNSADDESNRWLGRDGK